MKKKALTLFFSLVLTTSVSSLLAADDKKTTPPKDAPIAINEKISPLTDALVSAYNTNSSLQAKLHEQYARHETVNQAFSRFKPNIATSGRVGRSHSESRSKATDSDFPGQTFVRKDSRTSSPHSGNVTVTQNVYEGGGGLADLQKAESGVTAGRFDFMNTEQTTLLNAASAYMNVIFRKASVTFNQSNVKFLSEQLKAVNASMDVGDKTRTDVAQAESRLAEADAELAAAEGEVENAIANYKTVIGQNPGLLEYPNPLADLPKSRDEVINIAMENSPAIQQALFSYEQAKSDIDVSSAELLPKLDAVGNANRALEQSRSGDKLNSYEAYLELRIPIYQKGAEWSVVRQKAETAAQARYQLEQARKETQEAAVKAWENWVTAIKKIERFQKQVEFATISRDGAILEADVGERSYLDVLDAQKELVRAQVGLEEAKRDEHIAQFQLYAAEGKLTAANLNLPVTLYKEGEHLENVRYKMFGFGESPLKNVEEVK